MMLNKELLSKFEGSMSNNILLSNYSWFNLGGPAEYLFKPKDKNQLIEFLEFNKKFRYNLTIIGAGSNTLIRDKGIRRSPDRVKEWRSGRRGNGRRWRRTGGCQVPGGVRRCRRQ